jgi:NAD-dependent SIR2 family protein deacetylase
MKSISEAITPFEKACEVLKLMNPEFPAEFFINCPYAFADIINTDEPVKVYGFTHDKNEQITSYELITDNSDIAKMQTFIDENGIIEGFIDYFNTEIIKCEENEDSEEKTEEESDEHKCTCTKCKEPTCECGPESKNEVPVTDFCTVQFLEQLQKCGHDLDEIAEILETHGVILPELNRTFLEEYIRGERLIGIREWETDGNGVYYDYKEINENTLTERFDYIDTLDNIMGNHVATLKGECPYCNCYEDSEECEQHDTAAEDVEVDQRLFYLEGAVVGMLEDLEEIKEKLGLPNKCSEA